MKKGSHLISVSFLLLVLALSGCSGGEEGPNGNGGNENGGNGTNGGDISLITPFVNVSDMQSLESPFSGEHSGLDFVPNADLVSFQAASSGVVNELELLQNEQSSNWEVRVGIQYDSTYSLLYAFEPMSALESDGQTQLANILVSLGDTVAQGDVIGKLHMSGEGNHVHFGLFGNSPDALCPESYFTAEAREVILDLLHTNQPDSNMCD